MEGAIPVNGGFMIPQPQAYAMPQPPPGTVPMPMTTVPHRPHGGMLNQYEYDCLVYQTGRLNTSSRAVAAAWTKSIVSSLVAVSCNSASRSWLRLPRATKMMEKAGYNSMTPPSSKSSAVDPGNERSEAGPDRMTPPSSDSLLPSRAPATSVADPSPSLGTSLAHEDNPRSPPPPQPTFPREGILHRRSPLLRLDTRVTKDIY
uniref:Protein muscleblind n=1 Tax=Panagrellus redivivus TaxID=6233 RepID=A0A7E4ZZW0_PANRE